MTYRTGLRNRVRNGRGSYSRRNKSRVADRYGRFQDGTRKSPDVIGKYERAVDCIQDENDG